MCWQRLTKGLLFEGQEYSVQQLKVFEVIVDHIVKLHPLQQDVSTREAIREI